MSENIELNDLYKGLIALSEASFPKKCSSCGREYRTSKEFLEMTSPLRNSSGLKETRDFDEKQIVELFRNCVCGSTLMDEFRDRRDDSPSGKRKREIFEKTLRLLINDVVSREEARLEILQFIRGENSQLIDRLLMKKKPYANRKD